PRGAVEVLIGPGPVGQGERAVGTVEVEGHRRDVARHLEPGSFPAGGRTGSGGGLRGGHGWPSLVWAGFVGSVMPSSAPGRSSPEQQKTPWPLRLRRLRANAM